MYMMRLMCLAACGILFVVPTSFANDPPYGKVQLLDGYQYKRGRTIDAINGVIYKNGGLHIEFESGVSQGFAADPARKTEYIWFRQQQINGHKVFIALTQPGSGTKWRPEQPRNGKLNRILLVTFPGTFSPTDAANFRAEVLDEIEIAEMLLMVLTFDPTT